MPCPSGRCRFSRRGAERAKVAEISGKRLHYQSRRWQSITQPTFHQSRRSSQPLRAPRLCENLFDPRRRSTNTFAPSRRHRTATFQRTAQIAPDAMPPRGFPDSVSLHPGYELLDRAIPPFFATFARSAPLREPFRPTPTASKNIRLFTQTPAGPAPGNARSPTTPPRPMRVQTGTTRRRSRRTGSAPASWWT